MHLTNNSVQKNVPDYKTQKEQYINSVDDLIDDLLTTGRSHAHESHSSYIYNVFWYFHRWSHHSEKNPLIIADSVWQAPVQMHELP